MADISVNHIRSQRGLQHQVAADRDREKHHELELSFLQRELAECRQALAEAEAAIQSHREQLAAANQRFQTMEHQVTEARSREQIMKTQLEDAQSVCRHVKQQQQHLKEDIKQVKCSVSDAQHDAASQFKVG